MHQTCINYLHYFKIIILFILSINMAKRSASAVWKYFKMFQDRLEIGKCNICSQDIRRGPLGATSKKFSTKSLWGHLKSKHKNEHSLTERVVKRNRKKGENFKKA